jgi:hypothetical protein
LPHSQVEVRDRVHKAINDVSQAWTKKNESMGGGGGGSGEGKGGGSSGNGGDGGGGSAGEDGEGSATKGLVGKFEEFLKNKQKFTGTSLMGRHDDDYAYVLSPFPAWRALKEGNRYRWNWNAKAGKYMGTDLITEKDLAAFYKSAVAKGQGQGGGAFETQEKWLNKLKLTYGHPDKWDGDDHAKFVEDMKRKYDDKVR